MIILENFLQLSRNNEPKYFKTSWDALQSMRVHFQLTLSNAYTRWKTF